VPDRIVLPPLPTGVTIDAVVSFADASCPPFLMHHNYRTFRFGRMLVDQDLDVEVAFVASMLHDIGLVDPHIGTTSFEIVGADVAARFLESIGWHNERIRLVEQAIIRHVDLAPHDNLEMRVVQAGAAFDVAGFPAEALDSPATRSVLVAHPRSSMANDIRLAILAEIDRQPNGVFSQLEKQVGLSELVLRNPLDNLIGLS
jgi:HD domain